MKVLHIINSLNKGGAETNLYRLLKYDIENINNKNIFVLSFAPDGYFSEKIRKMGHKVVSLNIKKKYLLIFYLLRMFKIIKEINPDIVQTWMYHSCFFGGIISWLANSRNIIWSIRHSSYQYFKTKLTTIPSNYRNIDLYIRDPLC